MTCWHRLRDGQKAGVWKKTRMVLLNELEAAGAVDWSKAVLDRCSIRALLATPTGPNPTDRGQNGSKRHVTVDGHGPPAGHAARRSQLS